MHYQIAIADDHPLFRSAMKEAVQQAVRFVEVIEVDSLSALRETIKANPELDLVLLDLLLPDVKGFSGLIRLRGEFPALPVVMVSGMENQEVIGQAMHHGASGFIPKSASLSNIAQAIQSVLDGNIWTPENYSPSNRYLDPELQRFADGLSSLTVKQYNVLVMMCEGMMNKQIGIQLGVSEATIKAHITAIFKKLGVHSRTQVVINMQQLDVEMPAVPDLGTD